MDHGLSTPIDYTVHGTASYYTGQRKVGLVCASRTRNILMQEIVSIHHELSSCMETNIWSSGLADLVWIHCFPLIIHLNCTPVLPLQGRTPAVVSLGELSGLDGSTYSGPLVTSNRTASCSIQTPPCSEQDPESTVS